MHLLLACFIAVVLTGAASGGISDVKFHSALNKREVTLKVYTPPGYEQGNRRYPVVYNLHGGGGSPQSQWDRTRSTLVEAMENGRIGPMIHVYVDGLGNTLFLDSADGSLKVESMIVKEVLPFIDQRYRTVGSHEGRAIQGFSMGGFGALQIALKHPHLFSSVVSYAGAVLSPKGVPIGRAGSRFPTRAYFDANTPWGLLEKNGERIREHLRIRMVCGDQDERWYPGNVELKERAESLKIPVEWVPVPRVAHDTKGLYERAGLESLKFIEAGFAQPLGRPEGIAQDLYYWSEANKQDIWIKVYTPPGYASGKERYPVVYNLHGAGGGSPQRQWKRAGSTLKDAIESAKVRPMIYVFVNGLGDTFFLDYHDKSVKAETAIVKELIPFIDKRYRTIASREGRAIDGFSMGGGGALRLAIKYPEMFSSVVSYGAALIRSDRFRAGDSRYGTKENFHLNSPWGLIEQNADRVKGKLRIRMVCGDQDGLFPLNVAFKDLLGKLNIPVDWVVAPGVAHDTRGLYVRVGLESLRFMEQGFASRTR
jgi:endo-1,4-beta-xylanase